MARKAAKVAGKTGITSSSKNPLDKLPIHKRNYVKARAEGHSVTDSVKAAGVSRRMGMVYESEADVQAAYRMLVRQAIPAKKLVNLIKGGCEAKIPVYGPDGKKKGERADWKTRKGYIEMAAKHANYHEEKVGAGGGALINLTVTHIGRPSDANGNQRTIEASAKTEPSA